MPQRRYAPECETCGTRLKSIFKYLAFEDLQRLSRLRGCRFYRKGETIFFEGDFPLGIFCMHKGKAKIYKLGNNGKEQIVRLVGDGDFFGFRSLISGSQYKASAEALEDSAVCFIPKEDFFNVLQRNMEFSLQLMKVLCQELETAERYMLDLAQKSVRERLATVLLLLKKKYGTNSDKQTLNIHLTREDLANIVGTATETVIRLLSEFKEQNIIALEGKKIKLLDVDELVRIGNVYE